VHGDVPEKRFRLAVIGLDAVSPDLLYRRFAHAMPRLTRLLQGAAKGTLLSCDPPITIPAWAVMFSGTDPGTLGLYGFRHRRPGTYNGMYIPNSSTPLEPMIWQTLSRRGYRVAVVGMPPGYPPPRLNGVAVSDFLTPASATDWVNPIRYREELKRVAGGPFFDVEFRVEDRRRVADALFEMTRRRWRVVRHLWEKEPWDLFVVHEIGPDRLHHAFWKYFDEMHPRYAGPGEFSGVAEDYYRLLDDELGQLLDRLGPDVSVLVASDHGSQAMEGCFCINEWLRHEGLLTLATDPPRAGTPLEEASVDWSKTQVWGSGGYYARLFFNLEGREPQGIVPAAERGELTARLREALSRVRTPRGTPLEVRLFAPAEVYRETRGDPPDLMAYFGNLAWRSAGTVGHGRLFLEENDTGPDDSVHSLEGVIAWWDPGPPKPRILAPQRIVDVAPTILSRFGVELPARVQGRPIPELIPTSRRP
jgi:predicted AlkP superfamily phosphohydrolase/phosphomutase